MHTRLKPMAALLPFLFATASAGAQQITTSGEVVVTATRFHESSAPAAANVIIITREDIQSSGAQTLPDVLKSQAGLNVAPLYGSLGSDTAIDMRGFGEGAASRTLVLLDGQRLNSLDMTNIDWGIVPLDSIERVEIINGSGSILYGDNAVGGVINIITGKRKDGAHIQLGAGSQDGKQISAGFSRQLGAINLALSANLQDVDGWRQNNKQKRNNVAGRIGTNFDRGEAFVDLGWSSLDSGLPGALTKAQYDSNPKQAVTLDSYSERRSTYVRPGVAMQITDAVKFLAEAGYSKVENTSWISDWFSFDDRKSTVFSFTPRLQWQHGLGNLASKTTIGFDYYDGDLTSNKSASNHGLIYKTVRIDQKSQAVYLQNQTGLTTDLILTTGARHQKIDQSAADSSGLRMTNDHAKTIGELGLSYQLAAGARVFSRFGSTFRYANLDELTTFTGFAGKPIRPEQGKFIDAGVDLSGAAYALKVTAYSLSMKDEIAYNGLTYENENLAKTRHEGIDISARYDLDRQWQLIGGLNLQKAKFREGADSGKKVPLVPGVKANVGINFKPVAALNLSLLANHVGRRHSGGDTSNSFFEQLAAYTTADFVASWRQSNWTARARVVNLTDKKYAPSGYYGSYYPADGRTFFADLRYDF